MPHRSANELTPPADQVARFARDLEALTGETPRPDQRLALAVSGGPDSMALLLLAAAAYPKAVTAATFNHGLRAEANDEAALVAALCARLGVPHAVLPPPPPEAFAGNVQERARALRYAALGQWAQAAEAPWLAVAHQRNDVAETFLMRARRGSGVAGLAAMRRSRPLLGGRSLFPDEDRGPASDSMEDRDGGAPSSRPGRGLCRATAKEALLLVRPLLDWSREELAAVPRCLGVAVADDASNTDPRYDRARIRAMIDATPDLVPSRLALSAQNLRHAEDALEWAFACVLPRLASDGASCRFAPTDLPYELRRRLARHAVQHVRAGSGIDAPWHEQGLDRLVATLDAAGTGTIAGVKAEAKCGEWRFSLAPARRSH